MVSVIIPSFNQGQFLAQAIDSVRAQTWPDWELVVVDDGSTDDTPEVIARFSSDRRIRCIRQANSGVGAARNRGIRESGGDLICVLDADDWLHEEKLAAQVAQFERDPSLDWVYCDVQLVDAAGRPDSPYSVAQSRAILSGNVLDSLVVGGYFPPHAVMARRRSLEAMGGFDPALGGHADYDLWLRLSAAGHRVEFLPERLVYYRQYDGQMSRDGEHMRATRIQALEKLARIAPGTLASAVAGLQSRVEELHAANHWLCGRLDLTQPKNRFQFLDHLSSAEPSGRHAPAEWSADLGGGPLRALFLHPDGAVAFSAPTAARARLSTAVALHPETWSRPGSGACRFEVRVDGVLASAVEIDPRSTPAHRCWHAIELEIPAQTACHRVVFRTTAPQPADFRWALWCDPFLTWTRGAH